MNLIMAASEVDFTVLTTAANAVRGFFTAAWDVISSNAYTLGLVGVSVVSSGFYLFKRGKRAAR